MSWSETICCCCYWRGPNFYCRRWDGLGPSRPGPKKATTVMRCIIGPVPVVRRWRSSYTALRPARFQPYNTTVSRSWLNIIFVLEREPHTKHFYVLKSAKSLNPQRHNCFIIAPKICDPSDLLKLLATSLRAEINSSRENPYPTGMLNRILWSKYYKFPNLMSKRYWERLRSFDTCR